jgi:hypothetical protein
MNLKNIVFRWLCCCRRSSLLFVLLLLLHLSRQEEFDQGKLWFPVCLSESESVYLSCQLFFRCDKKGRRRCSGQSFKHGQSFFKQIFLCSAVFLLNFSLRGRGEKNNKSFLQVFGQVCHGLQACWRSGMILRLVSHKD